MSTERPFHRVDRAARERAEETLAPSAVRAAESLAGGPESEDEAPRIVCDAVDALLGVALGDCG